VKRVSRAPAAAARNSDQLEIAKFTHKLPTDGHPTRQVMLKVLLNGL
jgi:hypothetical protein